MELINIPPLTYEEFFAIPDGTYVYNYGADQCVALANQYDVGTLNLPLPSGIQSAFQWWTTFDSQPNLYNNFDKVTSNPRKGDIFVGRYGYYQAENGHIGVVESDWNGSTFGTLENGYWENGRSYVRRFNRNMSYILGFLRPKKLPTPTPVAGDEDMKQISFNGRRYLISMGAIQSIPVGEDVGDIYGPPIELGTNFQRGDAMNRICRAHGIPDWAWQQVGNGSDIAGNDHSWSAATGFYVTTTGPSNHPANVDIEAIKQAIKDSLGNINVNVDAIADAIADKLDLTCDCGCGVPVPEPIPDTTTKAEILSAIEENYPEDK